MAMRLVARQTEREVLDCLLSDAGGPRGVTVFRVAAHLGASAAPPRVASRRHGHSENGAIYQREQARSAKALTHTPRIESRRH